MRLDYHVLPPTNGALGASLRFDEFLLQSFLQVM